MLGVNGNIICKPHNLSGGLKSEVKSGFAFVQNKTDIIALEVLVDGHIGKADIKSHVSVGTIVYVKEERLTTMAWGKTVFKLAGKEVILIPSEEIVAVEREKAAE